MGNWPADEKTAFYKDLSIIENFISEDEEQKLLEEIEPHLKRMRYEFDHWDDAIHGFRETQRKSWYPHNRLIMERVRKIAFNGEIQAHIHILDLAEKGVIKPHVDSVRYCGSTIAGISLLSDSVMRLVRTDEKKYKQPAVGSSEHQELKQKTDAESSMEQDEYRNRPKTKELEFNFYANLLLPRRSLYIMR